MFRNFFNCACASILFLAFGMPIGAALTRLPVVAASQNTVADLSKPIERDLKGGETHTYQIATAAGEYLHLVVEQKGIDVVVAIFSASGEKITEVDSPNGTQGPEPVEFVTAIASSIRLEVRSLEAGASAGRYELKLIERRTANPKDKDRIAARAALNEGEMLRAQVTRQTIQQAIGKYQAALKLFQSVGDVQGQATCLNAIGFSFYSIGEPQKAIGFYEQTLPLVATLKDRSGEGYTLYNLGLAYSSMGEKLTAIRYYLQALPHFEATQDLYGKGSVLNGIGAAYAVTGDLQKAVEYYQKALPLREKVGDQNGLAVTVSNLGQVYDSLGRKQQALEQYARALEILEKTGNRPKQTIALINIGSVYFSLGESKSALQFYEKALALAEITGDRETQASILNNIGTVWFQLGDPSAAFPFFTRSLPLWEAIGNQFGKATTLNNIGLIQAELGDLAKAKECYDQALQIRKKLTDRMGQAQTLNNLGLLAAQAKDHPRAIELLTQSLELDTQVGNRWGQSQTLFNLTKSLVAVGKLTEARAKIEESLKLIEFIRSNAGAQASRSSFSATVHDHFELYIDVLMLQHQANPKAGHELEALNVSEQARARTLIETLLEAGADIRQGIDPKLLEREQTLEHRLSEKLQRLTLLLNSPHSQDQEEAAKTEIDLLTKDLSLVQAEIREKSPAYAALTQPQALTVEDIQQKVLDPKTVLLEYFLGETHSYVWAVTPTTAKVFVLPPRQEIELAARQVRELLISRNVRERHIGLKNRAAFIADADAVLPQAAAKLSALILGPVAGELGKKRLLIVADGALQYIPFAMLPKAGSGAGKGKSAKANPTTVFLIEDHEIVTLPSATTLAVLRTQTAGRKLAAKTLAILADPVFGGTDDERMEPVRGKLEARKADSLNGLKQEQIALRLLERTEDTSPVETRSWLRIPRLPFTRAEADQLAALVPKAANVMKATDFAASVETVNNGELTNFQYVHFATHGLLDTERPELSSLVLSLVNEQGQLEDGFLRSIDLYNLSLDAELVTLSACETGLGKDIRGEGLVGMTQGFFYAGAKRVTVSLWSVSDKATADLMTRFYTKMLRAKLTPAAALRAAQLELLRGKQWSAPYFWAPFVIQGEMN
ncbi:MAG: tetratricopeptide repeat protein [Acidobacteria bacterium]|nr:tetratricopeptide repeat protein [Acidobacteriota bacterium]